MDSSVNCVCVISDCLFRHFVIGWLPKSFSCSFLRGGWTRLQHYIPHAGGNLTLHHQGHGHLHLPPAHRSVCRHRPFQLPRHDSSVDVPCRDGVRQHLPDEALWASPRLHHAFGQNAPGCRSTRWYTQHNPRTACRWVRNSLLIEELTVCVCHKQ